MNDIQTYIQNSIRQGKSHEEIANSLRAAGWRDEAIDQAFIVAAHTPAQSQPTSGIDTSESSRLSFLYVLSFITLYISVFAFMNTAFKAIDSVFGDSLPIDGFESLRWSIAFLVVTFPVFLITNHFIRKTVAQNAAQVHMSSARRTFTYITLFFAALAFIISAVVLVYELTGGQLVTAAILKLLTTIFVAGGLFGYYFNDARQEKAEDQS